MTVVPFTVVDGPTDNEKLTIEVRPGELHLIATKAEKALLLTSAPFYHRGGEIVTPIVEEVAAFKGRRTKVVRLKAVSTDMLRDRLSDAAHWVRLDKRQKKSLPTDPPVDIAKIVLAREGTDWRRRTCRSASPDRA